MDFGQLNAFLFRPEGVVQRADHFWVAVRVVD